MHRTADLLDKLAARYNLPSDYAIAKHLAIDRQRVSNYRRRKDTLGADLAIKIADELGLDRGYVLACMAAERAKRTDERRAWETLAKKAGIAASLLIYCGILTLTPGGTENTTADTSRLTTYTLCAIALVKLALATLMQFAAFHRTNPTAFTVRRL